MLSKSTIMARPGWSAVNFDRLLGTPDHTTRVGHVIVQLYMEDRVLQAEASELFFETKRKCAVRKFDARNSYVLANADFAMSLDTSIEIVEFTFSKVQEGAIGHYNAARTDGFATRRDDKGFLSQIMVRYAFDVLAHYDRDFEARATAAGEEVVVRALRGAVFKAIASTYPELANDCFRQENLLR